MALQIQTFPDRDALMRAAAHRIESALRAGISARGSASAALSGGSTPEPAYALLASRTLDWSRVTFALADERYVPPSDPASNEAMVRRALATALKHGAKVAPMWSDAPTPEAAAATADALYAPLMFDVCTLGMGNDGHTASWFPGSPDLPAALDPGSPRTVIAVTAPGAPGSSARLTLSFAAVARTRRLILLIAGADKRARLEAAFAEPLEAAPIAAVLRQCVDRLDILWAA